MRRLARLVALLLAAAGCARDVGEATPSGVRILTNLSEQERAALSDKYVSFSEYEAAARFEIECLRALGVSVDPLALGADGTFMLAWETSFEGDRLDSARAGAQRCNEEVDAIHAVYVVGIAPGPTELRAVEVRFRECLAGVLPDTSGASSVEELLQRVDRGVRDGSVESAAAELCVAVLRATPPQPLPGLVQALSELDLD